MNLSEALREFAGENLRELPHPSQNKKIILPEFEELIDILFLFLEQKSFDPDLQGLKDNFELSLQKILSLSPEEQTSAIISLATNFEPFLRKLAYFKYYGTIWWTGDDIHEGISTSTLADLLSSSLPPKPGAPEDTPRKPYPEKLVDLSGTKGAILDFVRATLRNAVHHARQYSRVQLVQYANYAIGVYLMAIDYNRQFLKRALCPEYLYVQEILKNQELIRVNRHYIELFGVENPATIENLAEEILSGEKLLNSLSEFPAEQNEESEEEGDEAYDEDDTQDSFSRDGCSKVDSVLNIARNISRFILTGNPGSGKTTTLLKLEFQDATEFMQDIPGARIPIYLTANSYAAGIPFIEQIKAKVKFAPLGELAQKFKLRIMVDGLNEVDDSLKKRAYDDLKTLLIQYPTVSFLLSARRFEFFNHWNLPIYELKELSETQVRQFLISVRGEQRGIDLWNSISANQQLLKLCFNPLMLMMLIKVVAYNNEKIPSNKGLLYQSFTEAILLREKKIYLTDLSTKVKILSHLAFQMSEQGVFKRLKKERAKEILRLKLTTLTTTLGINDIFNELSDNNFFIPVDGDIEFIHESYQEYYAALEIREQFFSSETLNFDYSQNKWFEPLMICSDLLTKKEDQVRFLELLFIGPKKEAPKRLDDFTKDDLNDKFPIACKIAYNLKDNAPDLYKKIEQYISNYLTIWLHQRSIGIEIVPFEKLIDAVASLSSEHLFKKIFTNIKYLYYWFYNSKSDETSNAHELDQAWEEAFLYRSKTFYENLNDFTLAFTILRDAIRPNKYFWHSPSIRTNLHRFYKYLVENMPTEKIISAFKQLNSHELLIVIGRTHLNFYLEYADLFYKKDTQYKFILKKHRNTIEGQELLMRALMDEKVGHYIKLKICIAFLPNKDLFTRVLSILSNFVKDQDLKVRSKYQLLLARLPYYILQEYNLTDNFKQLDSVSQLFFSNVAESDPILYHPETLVANESLVCLIRSKFGESQEVDSFVKKASLTYLLSDLEFPCNYCIVLAKNDLGVCVQYSLYQLNEHKIRRINSFYKENTFEINDIVVLEQSHRLNKVEYTNLPKQLFKEGVIVSVNVTNQEGFVYSGQEKDFYFSFTGLSFVPVLWSKVQFIPGLNINEKYSGYPEAYCLRPIAHILPKAILKKVISKKEYFNIYLEDLDTKASFFSRIKQSDLANLSYFEGRLKVGQIFYYHHYLHQSSNGPLPIAKLISQVQKIE
ncbi:MAG TPA: hypothetical protein VHD83_02745 [Puia sp.]|nr:hypothetical protein [Puia sp.]